MTNFCFISVVPRSKTFSDLPNPHGNLLCGYCSMENIYRNEWNIRQIGKCETSLIRKISRPCIKIAGFFLGFATIRRPGALVRWPRLSVQCFFYHRFSWLVSAMEFSLPAGRDFPNSNAIPNLSGLLAISDTQVMKTLFQTTWLLSIPTWGLFMMTAYNVLALLCTAFNFDFDCLCNDDLRW